MGVALNGWFAENPIKVDDLRGTLMTSRDYGNPHFVDFPAVFDGEVVATKNVRNLTFTSLSKFVGNFTHHAQ